MSKVAYKVRRPTGEWEEIAGVGTNVWEECSEVEV